jgi:hypothetical protein
MIGFLCTIEEYLQWQSYFYCTRITWFIFSLNLRHIHTHSPHLTHLPFLTDLSRSSSCFGHILIMQEQSMTQGESRNGHWPSRLHHSQAEWTFPPATMRQWCPRVNILVVLEMNVDALAGICTCTEIVEKPRKFVPFFLFPSAEN